METVMDIAPDTQDLHLAAVTTDAELLAMLRVPQARAGKLSPRGPQARARRTGPHLPRTTAYKILHADRVPTRYNRSTA
jgi:hypothetical protein